jgi:hypothetical protein
MDSRDVSSGDTVHSKFSLVVKSEGSDEPFNVVRLHDLTRYEETRGSSDEPYVRSFLMPKLSGHLDSDTSSFSYEVIEETSDSQVIEVVEAYHDGDNTIWSRYEATRTSVTPISSRMFYFGYMFAALPYAIGIGLLLFVVGRFLRNTSQVSAPA